MENTPTWNIEQVWGSDRFYHEGDVAEDQIAFVIDSGVSLDTGDLNVNQEWSRSFIDGKSPFEDTTGHGTAVASVIGAKANYEGLTGVAPGAQIVAIKVFDGPGAPFTRIRDGVQHAYDVIKANNLHDRAVINMSLGGNGTDYIPLIRQMAEEGIRFAVSAGNSARDVDNVHPAEYGDHPNIYTVSSNTNFGTYSPFTNYDDIDDPVDDVDFTAPGSGIQTYAPNGSLRFVNGTSFSAPHVAGLLLMSDIKAGRTFERNQDQIEKNMSPDPLAMFDDRTYKHSDNPVHPEKPGHPPNCPVVDPIVIEVPVEVIKEVPVEVIVEVPVEVPVEVIKEVPVEVIKEVPVEVPVEVIVEKPVYIDVPQPITNFVGKLDEKNKINGSDGDDIIIGGNLKDKLFAGDGDDWIMGGGDKDKIYGGAGADTIVLQTGKGFDIIKDFEPGVDNLVLPEGEVTFDYVGNNTKLFVDDDLVARINGTIETI